MAARTDHVLDDPAGVVDLGRVAIVVTDRSGEIITSNEAADRLFAFGGVDVVGSPLARIVDPRVGVVVAHAMGGSAWQGDVVLAERGRVRLRVTPIDAPGRGGIIVTAIGEDTARDLDHRVQIRLRDALTGLATRPLLFERLDMAMARSARTRKSVAVVFVDVDGLKAVNDGWGHSVGDRVLVRVGVALQAALRPADTVARYGGDEFVVACEDVDVRAATVIADRLVRSIAHATVLSGPSVTGSIGVSLGSGLALDGGRLIDEADAAMYESKRRGGNRWTLAPAARRP